MKLILTAFLLLIFWFSYAGETQLTEISEIELRKHELAPHLTVAARTRNQWSIAFQRAVGANVNTHVLLSSLTLSVLDRLEIGTVPTHYLNEFHNYNFTYKYNFWRGKEFYWAFGGAIYQFSLDKSQLDPSLQDQDIGYQIVATQFAVNYFPEWTRLKFGASFNIISSSLTGVDNLTWILSYDIQHEYALDVSYPVHDKLDLTVGLGTLREDGVTAEERTLFGFGPSLRWYRPGKFFSSPTVGVNYTPNIGDINFLLSTSIY